MCPDRRIVQLRQRYIGRRVAADAGGPELARLAGRIGVVKAINCNGRAVVQSDGPDRSRYDFAPEFLRMFGPAGLPADPTSGQRRQHWAASCEARYQP